MGTEKLELTNVVKRLREYEKHFYAIYCFNSDFFTDYGLVALHVEKGKIDDLSSRNIHYLGY